MCIRDRSKRAYDIYNEKKNSSAGCYYFKDKNSLIKSVKDIIEKRDIVLIKGSRGNLMEDIIKYI